MTTLSSRGWLLLDCLAGIELHLHLHWYVFLAHRAQSDASCYCSRHKETFEFVRNIRQFKLCVAIAREQEACMKNALFPDSAEWNVTG